MCSEINIFPFQEMLGFEMRITRRHICIDFEQAEVTWVGGILKKFKAQHAGFEPSLLRIFKGNSFVGFKPVWFDVVVNLKDLHNCLRVV